MSDPTKLCTRCRGTGRIPDRRLGLTDDQRTEIRQRIANGEKQKDLAAAFSVSPSLVSRVKDNIDRRSS